MSSIQPQLDYLMAYWNIPCVITYPTPPYLTLRINIGFHQGPPLPRPRLLLDMIRKFSSEKDGRYYRPDGEEEPDVRLAGGEVYKIGTSQISQIHDVRNKWIFYNPPPGLMASPKQKSEGVNSYGLPSGYFGPHGSFSSSFAGGHNRRFYRPDGEEVLRLPGREVYRKRTSQTSQIHDEENKLQPDNPSSWLMATHKQNSDGAMFVITTYRQQSLDTKTMAVTLKIDGTNLYLSCIDGVLTLEDLNNNGKTLDTIKGSTRRFLFLRPRPNGQVVTFESVMSPGMLISTNTSQPSPVKMSKSSDQTKIVGFLIDEEVLRFNMVRNNNFSLQAPMEIPERLQEYNQLMGNTYERFTYRPYGILCFGRLVI